MTTQAINNVFKLVETVPTVANFTQYEDFEIRDLSEIGLEFSKYDDRVMDENLEKDFVLNLRERFKDLIDSLSSDEVQFISKLCFSSLCDGNFTNIMLQKILKQDEKVRSIYFGVSYLEIHALIACINRVIWSRQTKKETNFDGSVRLQYKYVTVSSRKRASLRKKINAFMCNKLLIPSDSSFAEERANATNEMIDIMSKFMDKLEGCQEVEPQMNIADMIENFGTVIKTKVRDLLASLGMEVIEETLARYWRRYSPNLKTMGQLFITTSLGFYVMNEVFMIMQFPRKLKKLEFALKIGFAVTFMSYINYKGMRATWEMLLRFFRSYNQPITINPTGPTVIRVQGPNEDEAFQAQMSLDFGYDDLITSVVSVYFASCNMKNLATPKVLSEFASIGKSKQGFSEILISLQRVMKPVFEEACRLVGMPCPIKMGTTGITVLDDYYKRSDDIIKEINNGAFHMSVPNYLRLTDVISCGEKIVKESFTHRTHKEFVSFVIRKNKEFCALREQFRLSNVTKTGLRQEPICWGYCGPPGSRKSLWMKYAANFMVVVDSKTDFEVKTHIDNDKSYEFNRCFEVVYWQSYHNEIKVVTLDEFGQSIDNPLEPENEYQVLIRMINTFYYDLHMADIDSKGKMGFGAIAVLFTTNRRRFEPTSIYSPEAFHRRVTGWYCTLKKKYWKDKNAQFWNEKIDDSKFPVDDRGKSMVTPEMYEFHRYSFKTGVVFEKAYSAEEHLELMRQDYLLKLQHYETNQKTFKSYDLKYWKELKEKGHYEEVRAAHDRITEHNIKTANMITIDEEAPKSAFERIVNQALARMPGAYTPQMDIEDLEMQPLIDEEDQSMAVNFSMDWEAPTPVEGYEALPKIEWSYSKFEPHFKKMLLDITPEAQALMMRRIVKLMRLTDIQTFNILEEHEVWNNLAKMLSHLHVVDKHLYNYVLYGNRTAYAVPPLIAPPTKWEKMQEGLLKVWQKIVSTTHKGFQWIMELWQKSWDWAKKHPLVTFFAVVSGAIGLAKLFTGDTEVEEKAVAQSMDFETRTKLEKTAPRKLAKLPTRPKAAFKPQIRDVTGDSIRKSISTRNVLQMCQHKLDGTKYVRGSVLMIGGTVGMLNFHYVTLFQNKMDEDKEFGETKLTFILKNDDHKEIDVWSTTVRHFVSLFEWDDQRVPGLDIVFCKFPDSMRPFRSIIDKFIPASKIEKLRYFDVDLEFYHRNYFRVAPAKLRGKCSADPVDSKFIVPFSVGDKKIEVDRTIEYEDTTLVGDCGSPVFVRQPQLGNTRILGTHFACSSNAVYGYGSVISQEEVQEHFDRFDEIHYPQEEWSSPVTDAVPQMFDNVIITGQTMLHHKSAISHSMKPSPLQNSREFEVKKAPSMLVKTDDISPLSNALHNYKMESIPDDMGDAQNEAADRATQSLEALIMGIPKPDLSDVLTVEEALWGIPGMDFINGQNSSSSPGPIYKRECPNLKKQLFAEGVIRDETNPALPVFKARIANHLGKIKGKIRPEYYYSYNMKSELRTLEKVLTGKTRGYNGGDLDHNTLCAMYFGKFVKAMGDSRIKNESSVGVNCKSTEWETLVHELRAFSNELYPEVDAGDYKVFDSSHWARIMMKVLAIINKWYGDCEENQWVRYMLWIDIVFPRVTINQFIFEPNRGQPSGNLMTPHVNNLINQWNFRYCFYRSIRQYELDNSIRIGDFRNYVRLSTHGDDNLRSQAKWLWKYLNAFTVPIFMAEIGFQFTTEDKKVATEPYRTLDKVEYLKRGFRFEPSLGHMVAPLSKDTIEEMILWTKKNMEMEVTIDNINTALQEAALWGNEYYTDFFSRVRRAVNETCPYLLQYIELESRQVKLDRIFNSA